MTASLALVLLRATEAWPAVFAGLIPVIGLVAVGYLLYRAARDSDDDDR
jgi:hypothetical protein